MSEFDDTHQIGADADDVAAAAAAHAEDGPNVSHADVLTDLEATGTPGGATGAGDALDGAREVGYVDFSQELPVPAPGADVVQPEPAASGPFYPNVAEWVDQWLLPHFKRDPRNHLWDPRWWEYTEAIAVLEALWQAWEFLRQDSMTGMAVFFRDYLWPLMRELTSTGGPFWKLQDITARELPGRWPLDAPPGGMFRTADHPAEQ
ncbi:DUF4913 domain-containing protein [Cellulomonas hominis]|uniref:DUF4913 domain-containing protein n=1 Tax=Cellulomonas hominis TaxID=156981 RepID=UPI001B98C10D|nr:DUF4913 domain-containing protein [Cellulomonas hominis]VTR76040.1 hypothetical protein CHMI_00796 [Cellulomonas hominis]